MVTPSVTAPHDTNLSDDTVKRSSTYEVKWRKSWLRLSFNMRTKYNTFEIIQQRYLSTLHYTIHHVCQVRDNSISVIYGVE